MGEQAVKHIFSKTYDSHQSWMYLDNIPQDYQTLMVIVQGCTTTQSGGGDNAYYATYNVSSYTSGNIDSSTKGTIAFNKGWGKISGNSGEIITNTYNTTQNDTGSIGNSAYFTASDQTYNTCVFYFHNYSDPNANTVITTHNGSIYFGSSYSGVSTQPMMSMVGAGQAAAEAVTNIAIGPNGNIQPGVRLSLYGMVNS